MFIERKKKQLVLSQLNRLNETQQRFYWWYLYREAAKRDLFLLAKRVLGYKDMTDGLHRDMCRFIQNPAHRKKLIIIPRGHFKTSVATISNCIRHILIEPNIRILIASSTLKNASDFVQLVKAHFQQNAFFRFLFPEYCPPDSKEWFTKECFTVPNRSNFRLVEHTVECIGADGKITGRHYDVLIKDDLVTKETVTTNDQIEKTKEWNSYSMSLFNIPERDIEYIIGTRYHYSDLYGGILDDEDSDYVAYLRQAVEQGEPIFKKRFTLKGLDEIRKNQGSYIYNCQYMNEPISSDTAIFRPENFKEIDLAQVLSPNHILITTDAAVSERDNADYSVIMVSAYDYLANIYVLEIFRERVNPTKFINKLFELYNKYYPVRRVSVETRAYQLTLVHHIKKEEAKRGIILPKKELPRDTNESKYSRILHLQPRFENGTIYVARGIKNSKELLNQMTRYPKVSHDDILDALADVDLIASKPDKEAVRPKTKEGTMIGLVDKVKQAQRMAGVPGNQGFTFYDFYKKACGYH